MKRIIIYQVSWKITSKGVEIRSLFTDKETAENYINTLIKPQFPVYIFVQKLMSIDGVFETVDSDFVDVR